MVVTHDRWFLDAVCQHDLGGARRRRRRLRGRLRRVRARQGRAAAAGGRLGVRAGRTWCARSWPGCGAAPPARTSKPKFRIDAANALIEDEPPPRDRLELQRFATQRLGKDVIDVEDVDLVRGERTLLVARHLAARARATGSGIVGVNGAGKTSVLSLLAGDARADRAAG